MALLVDQPYFPKIILQFYFTKCTLTSLFKQQSTFNLSYGDTKEVDWTWSVKNVLCPNEMHKPDNIKLKIVNKQIIFYWNNASSYIVGYCGVMFVVFKSCYFDDILHKGLI